MRNEKYIIFLKVFKNWSLFSKKSVDIFSMLSGNNGIFLADQDFFKLASVRHEMRTVYFVNSHALKSRALHYIPK